MDNSKWAFAHFFLLKEIMLNRRSDKMELIRIAEAVATEKSIDKEIILSSMESAIQKAAKTRFGSDNDIRAIIDRESGDITLHKVLTIVEKLYFPGSFVFCKIILFWKIFFMELILK